MFCTIRFGNLVSFYLTKSCLTILSALSGAFSGPSLKDQRAGITGMDVVIYLSFELVNLDA